MCCELKPVNMANTCPFHVQRARLRPELLEPDVHWGPGEEEEPGQQAAGPGGRSETEHGKGGAQERLQS